MITFTVYKCEENIYIDKTHSYRSGEILCEYLNMDFGTLEEKRALLADYADRLKYPQTEEKLGQYCVTLKIVHRLVSSLVELARNMPPFRDLDLVEEPELIGFVAEKAGAVMPGAAGGQSAGPFLESDNAAGRLAIMEINNYMKALHKKYIDFCDDVLRVKYLYRDFMENYAHFGSDTDGSVEVGDFMNSHRESSGKAKYLYLTPIYRPYNDYDVISVDKGGESKAVLCEVARYYDAGSFLAGEFFSGIQSGLMPKICTCCGRYFLPAPGYLSEFCTGIAPGETSKTCRDIGARKKYDNKVKSDPIWSVYQRSYKMHYARYMKKKMTSEEFNTWSKFASELRDRMLENENQGKKGSGMSLSEYEEAIRE